MIIPAKTNKPYILPPKVTIYGGIFLPMLFNCFEGVGKTTTPLQGIFLPMLFNCF